MSDPRKHGYLSNRAGQQAANEKELRDEIASLRARLERAKEGIKKQLKRGDFYRLGCALASQGGGIQPWKVDMSTASYLRLRSLGLIQDKPNNPDDHPHLVTITELGKEIVRELESEGCGDE